MPSRDKVDALALLSGMRQVFAESEDYESTLAAIAHLVLPYVGSWCAVDVCEEDGSIRRLAVIHPDPSKRSLVQALEKGWPPEFDDPLGAPAVMRTRKTVRIAHVTDEVLHQVARTPENLRALLALGIGSVITVPLLARDSVLGAITFVGDAGAADYDASDVLLAENLAGLAALALDNARHYRGAIRRAKEDAANQARTEFLSTMSHEIRTPINAILGYAELLDLGLSGPLKAKQREYVSRQRASGEHLLGLVSDVLDLAKAEAGKLSVAGEFATTSTAIATAITMIHPAAQAANVLIVDDTQSDPERRHGVSYVGDEQRVRQILLNLLANAVRFSSSGGRVTVSCGILAESPVGTHLSGLGPWAYITVADTGTGVAPHQHSAVFEPFVQAEGGLRRTKGGTGLGLTISRRLARLMGGDLTLDARKRGAAGGATFTLWMPSTRLAGARRATDAAELAGPRIARALGTEVDYRVYGLAEIGRHLRGRVEEVLSIVALRLRTDPTIPNAAHLSASAVEDHQLAFLVDVVQSLIVIEETGGVDSHVYHAGSDIQRLVSSLHGQMRHRQGWTVGHLDREFTILHEELQALVHRYVPDGVGDVTAALAVIEHLVDQSCAASVYAYREIAAQNAAHLGSAMTSMSAMSGDAQ